MELIDRGARGGGGRARGRRCARYLQRKLAEAGHGHRARVRHGFFDDLPVPSGFADLVVACSVLTPAPGPWRRRRAWPRWSGCAGPVAVSPSSGRTTSAGSTARDYRYESFAGPMAVEFASHREAVELAEIFYPHAVSRGPPPRQPAGPLRGAGHQPAARPRLQGDHRVKVAIMAPLVSAIREPQGGGSQAFVSDLARGLAGRGHDVHVYAATGSQIPGVTVIDTGVDPEIPGGHPVPGRRPGGPRPGPGRIGLCRRLRRGRGRAAMT